MTAAEGSLVVPLRDVTLCPDNATARKNAENKIAVNRFITNLSLTQI
jgi:hypothetical protein